MADDERGFEQAFRSNLLPAQRREILATLRATLKRETTLGQIIDAAESLGWGEAMGDLRLADLARSLLLGEQSSAPVASVGGRGPNPVTDGIADGHDDSVAFSQAEIDYRPGDIDEDEGLEALDDADGSDVFAGDLVAELAPPSRKAAPKSSRAPALFVGEGWERSRQVDASPAKPKGKSASTKITERVTEKAPAQPTQIRGASAGGRATGHKKVSKAVAEAPTKSAKTKASAVADKPSKKSVAAKPAPSKSAPMSAKKATTKKATAKKSGGKSSSRKS